MLLALTSNRFWLLEFIGITSRFRLPRANGTCTYFNIAYQFCFITHPQVLRSDSLKLMERELFIYFFTDPQRLKRAIAELAARVDGHIVSLK